MKFAEIIRGDIHGPDGDLIEVEHDGCRCPRHLVEMVIEGQVNRGRVPRNIVAIAIGDIGVVHSTVD